MSEGCLPVGDIEYIVELVDNTGEVVEQRVVTSDNCSNGTCSILIPPVTCRVGVQATSPFGNSMTEVLNIGKVFGNACMGSSRGGSRILKGGVLFFATKFF